MDEAFARLRGYARSHSRRLSEVAEELIRGLLADDAFVLIARRSDLTD